MIPRQAAAALQRLSRGYPVVVLTGPRQSGKTTLARAVFPRKPYASLEDPDRRAYAVEDPRRFLAQYPDGAVLDEVQRAPDLLSYIQTLVDADRRPGRFILTGSQQFGLMEGVSQSLAGRAGFLTLLPFSLAELAAAGRAPESLDELLLRGFYPALYDRPEAAPTWHANYTAAYVERDVRRLLNVRDLEPFQRFVRLCAARTAQLLNLSALAADAGLTHNTVKAWVSVMEASHLVFLLRPHHANPSKRLIKTPKLYLADCGLASWLLGLREPAQVAAHPLRGALFETFVIGEARKALANAARSRELSFFRERSGREVDLLVADGTRLCPVEVKSGATIAADFFAGLEHWKAQAGRSAGPGAVVFGGDDRQERGGWSVLPWRALAEVPSPLPGLGGLTE